MMAINLSTLLRNIFRMFFLLICLVGTVCYAQNTHPYQLSKIVPMNPEAAKFANYFYTPSVSSTGSIPIDIPLYELVVDGVTIPISLSYQTSGIRVTDLSGSVGLGWSLNVGGGIYRSINGLPDDKQENASTFLNTLYPMSNYVGEVSPVTLQDQSVRSAIYSNSGYDINQDNYSYNFLGRTGGLFFNKQFQLKQLNADKLSVSFDSNYLNYFLAKDDSGNSYKFDVKEKTMSTSIPNSGLGSALGTTGWKLGEITTIHNKKINFSYLDYNTSYTFPSSSNIYRIKVNFEEPDFPDCLSEQRTSSTTYSNISNFNKLISEVSTQDVKIFFNYSDNSAASNWKRKLDNIEVRDNGNNIVKKIRFEYAVFSGDPRLKLTKLIFESVVDQKQSVYSFLYDETRDMPLVTTMAKDIFGFYNGYNNTTLLKTLPLPAQDYAPEYYSAKREVNETYITTGSLRQITYPTSGGLKIYYGANRSGDKYSPGIRVEKLEVIDADGTIVNTKMYSYGQIRGLNLTFPDYAIKENPVDPLLNASFQCYSFSSERTTMREHLPSNFFYEDVTIKEIDNGQASTIVEYYKEPYVDYTTDPLEDYVYQPILNRREFYKGDVTNGNLVKAENFEYTVIVNQEEAVEMYEVIPAYNRVFAGPDYADFISSCFKYHPGLRVRSIIKPKWVRLESQSEQYFFNSGSTGSGTSYFYENPNHKYATRTTKVESNGNTVEQKYKYPLDLVQSSNDPLGVYQLMCSLNMIGSSVISTKESGGQIEGSMNEYVHSTYSFPVLKNIKSFNPVLQQYEERVSFGKYNNGGQILSQSITGGANLAYLYSYNNQYPIAEIKNVAYSTVESLLGGATAVNTFAVSTPTDAQVNTFLASLRTALPDAQITSFTYKPLVGMTSMTDAKGMTTYYSYDGFQRLESVKDHYGNIVKNYCYNYKGQLSNCGTTYLNSAQSQSFTKNNCSPGETGGAVIYTVAAGTYSSSVSQAAADALALADISANGQGYANNNGTCVQVSACKRYSISMPLSESNNLYVRYKPCGSSTYVTSAVWQLEQDASMDNEMVVMLCTETPMYDVWFMYGEYGPSQIINGLSITEIGSCQ